MKKIDTLILYFAFLTPALPKLMLSEDITMYPLEILLLIFLPLHFKKIAKFKIQIYLLCMWTFTLLSTFISFTEVVSISGLMRVIKGIIYIPLIYIMYEKYSSKEFNLRTLLYIYIVAGSISIILFISNRFGITDVNNWDVEMINAGLSNRYFDIKNLSFGTIKGGAHGIWGNYCALIFAINIYLKLSNQISYKLFLIIFCLATFNIMSSVSREALISISLVISSLLFVKDSTSFTKINKTAIIWLSSIIITLIFIIIFFGDQLPLIEKLIYMQESIAEQGTESNLQLRINGWIVFAESLLIHPERIIIGYGFNMDNYINYMHFGLRQFGNYYVSLPESYFIQILGYGGIFALIFGTLFWKEIFVLCKNYKDLNLRIILIFFFIGLLIGNIFSGASILSDMLYSQVLLLMGYLKLQSK